MEEKKKRERKKNREWGRRKEEMEKIWYYIFYLHSENFFKTRFNDAWNLGLIPLCNLVIIHQPTPNPFSLSLSLFLPQFVEYEKIEKEEQRKKEKKKNYQTLKLCYFFYSFPCNIYTSSMHITWLQQKKKKCIKLSNKLS